MKLPEAAWRTRAGMPRLLRALGAAAGATRFVGGCVRDTLLKLEVNDVDLATRLPPEKVIARLAKAKIKAVPTGLAHGTVTAVVNGAPVEVTTLRRDVATDGRRATIAYTEDWREDAARRRRPDPPRRAHRRRIWRGSGRSAGSADGPRRCG